MQTNKRLFTVNVTSYPAIGFSGSTERVILKVPPNSEVLSKNVPNISMKFHHLCFGEYNNYGRKQEIILVQSHSHGNKLADERDGQEQNWK